jgi:hypothetical protein
MFYNKLITYKVPLKILCNCQIAIIIPTLQVGRRGELHPETPFPGTTIIGTPPTENYNSIETSN